ncbi:hypothetical protein QNH36_22470 [Mesobacillus sp. AQ2]|uniref:tetratricopeptide repeat protein n=1 Tax=Mesobacillus sp. AQ2 TaxID=3043332 RepID=UPI0024C11A46|nr:hypothetical protein [Mesobacillus sp. AQ2]WHX40372.1 hypothetical protein QNH36_22470 [Mesobacillus sp. AQ2]
MRFVQRIITMLVLGLMIMGIIAAFKDSNKIDANYLLTVIASVGAFGGVAFALYGWYSTRELPKLIQKEVSKKIEELDQSYRERLYIQQQVLQKMNAVYGIENSDRKILLLNEIIKLDPSTYNVYNTMAYVHWYEKNDLDTAEEYFLKDLQVHADNYQTMSDLVFLFIASEDWKRALKWLKKTLKKRPATWKDFDVDPRITPLKEKMKIEYEDALNIGKSNPS